MRTVYSHSQFLRCALSQGPPACAHRHLHADHAFPRFDTGVHCFRNVISAAAHDMYQILLCKARSKRKLPCRDGAAAKARGTNRTASLSAFFHLKPRPVFFTHYLRTTARRSLPSHQTVYIVRLQLQQALGSQLRTFRGTRTKVAFTFTRRQDISYTMQLHKVNIGFRQ